MNKSDIKAAFFLLYTFVLFASVVGSVMAFTTNNLQWAWYGGSAFFIGIYGLLYLTERGDKL